jgi:hypothetical protein
MAWIGSRQGNWDCPPVREVRDHASLCFDFKQEQNGPSASIGHPVSNAIMRVSSTSVFARHRSLLETLLLAATSMFISQLS